MKSDCMEQSVKKQVPRRKRRRSSSLHAKLTGGSLSSQETSRLPVNTPVSVVMERVPLNESSEGDVVDLTNDSGVEDSDDVVELAATDVQEMPVIVPEHVFLHERPSCVFAGQSPDVQITHVHSSEDVQVMSPRVKKRKACNTEEPVVAEKAEDSRVSCPVCMDSAEYFKKDGRNLVTTICGHVFCSKCIRAAITRQHRCPVCLRRLTLKQYHSLFL